MKRWSLDSVSEQRLITDYLAGKSSFVLAHDYGTVPKVIRNLLRRKGIAVRGRIEGDRLRRAIPPEEIGHLVESYCSGKSVSSLASQYNVTAVTIYRLLHCEEVPLRYRRLPLQEDVFDVPTETSVYWLGFLMADGNVSDTGSITLTLANKDRAHVECFRTFMGSGHKLVQANHGRATQLSFLSRPLAKTLARYGIVPRKSLVACAHGGLENNRHFWRGVVDGDGWLGKKRSFLTLVGACPLLRQFAAFVQRIVPAWRGASHPIKGKRIWRVSLGAGTAEKVVTELYRDCSVALPRKLERANRIVCWGVDRQEAAASRPVYVCTLPTEEQQRIVEMYRTGLSANAVRRSTGHTHITVLRILHAQKVLRRRDPVQRKRIIKLYASGLTIRKIVSTTGHSPVTVFRVLHAAGVQMRTKGRQRIAA